MTVPDQLRQYNILDMNTFHIPPDVIHTPEEDILNTSASIFPVILESSQVENPSEDVVLCKRCGRPLKDLHSKDLGMGPTCYRQYKLERSKTVDLLHGGVLGRCDK